MTTNNDVQSNSDVIGVLFGRQKLDGCRITRTLFGTTRHQQRSVELVDGDLDTALDELLDQLGVSKGTPLPIVGALPTEECYFATRPIAAGSANASPRVLLRESLRSSATRLDEMSIDVINWQPDRRSVAGIVAAPTERIESIREAVAKTKHSLQRLYPAASCLIAAAPDVEGRERRTSLTTRVFLGDASMLAVMGRGAKPIHWHLFPLPAGDEARGIVSSIRALETAAGACGIDRNPDALVIHGRPELRSLIDQQWLIDNVHNDLRWIETPTLHGSDIAQAAADRYLASEDDGFDLIRQHRDPLQLRRVVPYREIGSYALAACLLAGVLWMRHTEIEDNYAALVAGAPPMVADGSNPKAERDLLNARATAVSQFLDKRVQWSGLLGEITRMLPEGTRLTGIRGSSAMAQRRKKQVKTSPTTLILNAECVLDEAGNLPPSLDTLAAKVQSIENVKKHFKRVEISDVRRVESQENGVVGAAFSVILTNDTKGAS